MNLKTSYGFQHVPKVIAIYLDLVKSNIYSESKQMTITNAHFTTILGHFSANCMFVFHKTEVQTVILRCLMGLNLDWLKIFDL